MKLLVLDKIEAFREGLARVLIEKEGIDEVVTCGIGSEAIEKTKEIKPDLVIIDAQLGEDICIELIQCICTLLPNTRFLILCEKEGDISFAIIKAGAHGCVCKHHTIDEIFIAIKFIANGGVMLSPPMAAKILDGLTSIAKNEEQKLAYHKMSLTKREQEILSLVAEGASNKDVANTLFLSENTVKVHLHNIMEKMQVHSRMRAVVLARENRD